MSSGPEWWNQRVEGHLLELTETLRPALLLDKLLEKAFITLEDYGIMQDLQRETDRARYFLHVVLPRCLESTLDGFCTMLKETNLQYHVECASLLQRPLIDSDKASSKPQPDFKQDYQIQNKLVLQNPGKLNRQGQASTSTAPSRDVICMANVEVKARQRVAIAKRFAGRWEELAAYLEPELFTKDRVLVIKKENTNQFLQAKAMLDAWSEKLGSQGTCEVMINGLLDMGCKAEASELFSYELVESVQQQSSETKEQLVLVPVAKAGTNAPLKDAAQIVSVETPTAEFTMTAEKEHIVCPPVPSMQAQKQDDGTQSLSGKVLPAVSTAADDTNLSPSIDAQPKKIIMAVDSVCIKELESRRHVLESVCRKHWKAELEVEDIEHLDLTHQQSQTRQPSCTSYFLKGKKLVIIVLHGICRDGFETTNFLLMLKAFLRLRGDEIEILDVPNGSVMVVMRFSVNIALDLLCQFDKMNDDILPDLHPDIYRVDIYIGGLPMLSGEIKEQTPKKKKVQVHVKFKGTTAPLDDVERKTTGAELKNQLEVQFSVPSHNQRLLIYKDSTRVLSNFHSLQDYDMDMTIPMELLSCSSNDEFVHVRYPLGNTVSVQLDLCDTVMDIKEMLGSLNCELVSASKRRTLLDSEVCKDLIPNDSVLFLVPVTANANFENLLVKRLTGETIQVSIPSLDINVESLMAFIQHQQGIPMEMQSIVFAGKTLEAWNTLSSYKICSGSTLHLICKSRMTMTVFCKKSDDTLEKVDIGKSKAEETIGSLKTAVEAKIGIPVENQQLYLYGQTLEDVRTLQHYEIQCWTTLELKETEIR